MEMINLDNRYKSPYLSMNIVPKKHYTPEELAMLEAAVARALVRRQNQIAANSTKKWRNL